MKYQQLCSYCNYPLEGHIVSSRRTTPEGAQDMELNDRNMEVRCPECGKIWGYYSYTIGRKLLSRRRYTIITGNAVDGGWYEISGYRDNGIRRYNSQFSVEITSRDNNKYPVYMKAWTNDY